MVAQYSESYHRGLRLLFFWNLMWERFFNLTENKTTLQREMWGGLTTFMTSAYIIFVQPVVMNAAGMNLVQHHLPKHGLHQKHEGRTEKEGCSIDC